MNSYYEPKENIAGIARRARTPEPDREFGGESGISHWLGTFQEGGPDVMRDFAAWVRLNLWEAVGFVGVSFAFLYIILNGH